MAIIKKKDLYNTKLDELIDLDGAPIEGDETYNTTSQINVGVDKAGSEIPATTTDKAVHDKTQGNRYPWGPSGIDSPGGGLRNHLNNMGDQRDLEFDVDESVKLAEDKMKKMVEDIMANKSTGNDMVRNVNTPDVNRNNIPDIAELKQNKPVTANAAIQFVVDLNDEPLQGDEKAIMLNYIISNMKLTDISSDYRRILKSKF